MPVLLVSLAQLSMPNAPMVKPVIRWNVVIQIYNFPALNVEMMISLAFTKKDSESV